MYTVIAKNEIGEFVTFKSDIFNFTEAKKYSVTIPSETRIVPSGRVDEALELANA